MTAKSTFLSVERPASPSRQEESGAESPTLAEISPSSLSAWLKGRMRDGWSGRMFQPCLPAMAGGISPLSSPNSSDGTLKSRTAGGETRESSPMRPDASAFRGECWTLDIPEFPHFQGRCRSEGVVSSLSDAVIAGKVPQRYCLAANYAVAMLARAERLGYPLPLTLENVLRESASR